MKARRLPGDHLSNLDKQRLEEQKKTEEEEARAKEKKEMDRLKRSIMLK